MDARTTANADHIYRREAQKKREARTAELARTSELGNREEWEAALQEYREEQQHKREKCADRSENKSGVFAYI